MRKLRSISVWTLASLCVAYACTAHAQEPIYRRLFSGNAPMAEVQPTWMSPLTHSDARLSQGMKLSVARSSQPGAEPFIYGNNHGISVIAGRRFQLDFDPPSYFRNHCSTMPDGFGNAGAQIKTRIASGNAAHGNFAVTAILYRAFSPRIAQNEMLTGFYEPAIAAGRGFGRFTLISSVGGMLPTGKIAEQGRAVEWNMTAQAHAAANLWFDIENNAEFYHAGPWDGDTQDFVTPAAFYRLRRRDWKPEHPVVVFAGGEQIATTSFHFCNHNVIVEMRLMF